MPGKRSKTMNVREILRHIREGQSNRAIARATGVNRKTVGRYRAWAAKHRLLEGGLPSLEELQQSLEKTLGGASPPQNVSSVEPYRGVVIQLRKEGVEIAAIQQRLQERGYRGSYASVHRFVRNLEPATPEDGLSLA